jgi:RND superfamily putative drug exporter
VSRDGHTTFGLVYLSRGGGKANVRAAIPGLRRAKRLGAHIYITGIAQLRSHGRLRGPGVLIELAIGALGALVVLAFVFGSLLAILPILVALISIPTTFLIIRGLAAITDVSYLVQYLVALIGLGVAIDYSLLIITRWREERARGLSNRDAVLRSMQRAGSAVAISGTTVAVGLVSLVVLPLPFMRSIGYAGMLIPLVSVAVALTFLPALLLVAGPALDMSPARLRVAPGRFWLGWGTLVTRWRWGAALLALAILVALIVPATSLVVGNPRADSLAGSGNAATGLKVLERTGIGSGVLTPIEIVTPTGGVQALVSRLARVSGVLGAVHGTTPAWSQHGQSLIDVFTVADASSAAGRSVLTRVRSVAHDSVPAGQVGGIPTENADFIAAIYDSFPLMVVLVALVTFLLLARAFRSVLLPLKAVLLVLLSVVAAWGVLVLVWQDGYGSRQVWGIAATGSVAAFIPLMIFAFLFGLSMDYEVFILSRIREEYDATGSTQAGVVQGLARTGRLVTTAALVLIISFISLMTSKDLTVRIFATGMAAAILLDATVVRMLLVPAIISILGRWSWWMPDWAHAVVSGGEPIGRLEAEKP